MNWAEKISGNVPEGTEEKYREVFVSTIGTINRIRTRHKNY